ncbi:MAG: DUF3696 domain-containing protein [Sedimentisphaerales bacterium]|nr:DUF3696 domain-containing protein [Sedimentisphaerales bacterium]
MLKKLQSKNFKSWSDTTALEFAPLTGLFGTNSSGKTGILQLLLMLKQTVESTDRKRVLHTGDEKTYVDLGTFYDLIHGHKKESPLDISISWRLNKPLQIKDPEDKTQNKFNIDNLRFDVKIKEESGTLSIAHFQYSFKEDHKEYSFGMKLKSTKVDYELIADNYTAKRFKGRAWPLPNPVKCYGFPDEVNGYYQNVGFLSNLVLEFESLFGRIAYLGPLRDYPKRIYTWAGEAPSDVGRKGEMAISAMLAAKNRGPYLSLGQGRKKNTIEERIAFWLKEMGIIENFSLERIAKNRKDFELRVQKTKTSPQVLITDVGFGVSQILPVLVLCYYVPKGSIILLEQPEIHLHPLAQTWLADVFIDVVKNRNVQIIVESHSEHLIRRLQRRIAEEMLPVDQTAFYFCRMENSSSIIDKLELDIVGNINNWPTDFFGDEIGEVAAKTKAAMRRQTKGN